MGARTSLWYLRMVVWNEKENILKYSEFSFFWTIYLRTFRQITLEKIFDAQSYSNNVLISNFDEGTRCGTFAYRIWSNQKCLRENCQRVFIDDWLFIAIQRRQITCFVSIIIAFEIYNFQLLKISMNDATKCFSHQFVCIQRCRCVLHAFVRLFAGDRLCQISIINTICEFNVTCKYYAHKYIYW